MSHPAPEVSVIIPVFHAQDTLPQAIAAIRTPDIPLEIIVSVDDGQDYHFALDLDPRVVIVDNGTIKSGPGATRNRAIAAAKAPYLAYLDADDTWSEGYLSALLPPAKKYGAAFGLTKILDEAGQTLVTLPKTTHSRLTLADIATWGASFHPVHKAELHQSFRGKYFWEIPAQDVMHTVEILLACGNEAPLIQDVSYQLQLRENSVTRVADFSARIEAAYTQYDHALKDTIAAGLFGKRAALNEAFIQEGQPGETFYGFLARFKGLG